MIMPITEAQARRALRHADIPWDREVDDPREDAWVVHDHLGLLGGMIIFLSAFLFHCASRAVLGGGARIAPPLFHCATG